MGLNIDTLHDKARRAIASGADKFREAAEFLAEARKLGATQRRSAKAIGRSQRWVSALLQWRESGHKGAPFEKPKRTQRDTPATHGRGPRPAATPEQAQARIAKANAERAKAEAQKAKAEAAKAQAEFQKARADASARMFGPQTRTIPDHARELLIRALRALDSDRSAERAAAALVVEN
jgi:hypothetical protein